MRAAARRIDVTDLHGDGMNLANVAFYRWRREEDAIGFDGEIRSTALTMAPRHP
jgi:hypothetical protein